MKKFIKNNWSVLFLYLFLIGIALYYILRQDKLNTHLFLNQFVGHPSIDFFFYYITFLGDGFFAIFLLLLLIVLNIRTGIYTVLSFLSASLVSQILKRYVYDDIDRPWLVFQQQKEFTLRLVDGVDTHIHNSFPSGHATQAFAIFMCLVFVIENKFLKILVFSLAFFTAFSRVYLSQHWLNDVVAGSAIGFAFSILFYFLMIDNAKLDRLNTPLFSLKKKDASSQK